MKIKIGISASVRIYICLILTLAILSALSVFLPQDSFLPPQQQKLPSKSVLAFTNAIIGLVLYGSLGFIGLKLSQKLGFAEIWDEKVTNKQRFLIPALVGLGLGVFFISVDSIFSQFHALGLLPHPSFPASLVASATAGIGEEVIFRLFFILFWVWLISYAILKGRWQNQIFWIVAFLSALAFAFGHIPSVMILYGLKTAGEIPPALMSEIVVLNGTLSIVAACYLRKYGFLAPGGIHFWTDVVWHVVWGVITSAGG